MREACERKGLAAASVVEQLEAELADKSAPAQNPAKLPPHELADYIFQPHHQFLWCEMPRLHAMAERVKECFSWCAGIVVWTHRLFSLSIDLLAPAAMVECTAETPR